MGKNLLSFEKVSERLKKIGEATIKQLFNDNKRRTFDADNYAAVNLSDTFLRQVPFGQYLCDSVTDKSKGSISARVHLLYVISAVTEFKIDGAIIPQESCEGFNSFLGNLSTTIIDAKYPSKFFNKMHYCAALYHDIGNAIAEERHPYEGYHLIHDLGAVQPASPGGDKETDIFIRWLSQGSNVDSATLYRFFSKLMRYHDMWGNITTGEASVVMFSPMLELTESRSEGHLAFLGYLLLLNLADQFGAPSLFEPDGKPKGIPKDVIDHLLEHWNVVYNVLTECKGNPETARRELMKHAESERETVERIGALLRASKITIPAPQVQDTLRAECGGRFVPFCRDFGVVRLSYALRFFRRIHEIADSKKIPLDRQASLVIRILKRIIDTYESLIRANREQGRETGIEMSWLTRSAKVKDSIIESLIGQSPEAFSWVDDEISAFPCG